MLKVVLAFVTAAVILAIGFVVVPKVLLKTSGADSKNTANVPIAKPLDLSVTPSARGAAARRVQTLGSIDSAAGFHALTPSTLPNGYVSWETYYEPDSATVVVTYRKSDNMYLVVAERKPDQQDARFSLPAVCPTPLPGYPTPTDRGRFGRSLVQVGGSCGQYQQIDDGRFGFAQRLLAGAALGPAYNLRHPHQIAFTTQGGILVAVEGDQQDVPRDRLVQFAASLR